MRLYTDHSTFKFKKTNKKAIILAVGGKDKMYNKYLSKIVVVSLPFWRCQSFSGNNLNISSTGKPFCFRFLNFARFLNRPSWGLGSTTMHPRPQATIHRIVFEFWFSGNATTMPMARIKSFK